MSRDKRRLHGGVWRSVRGAICRCEQPQPNFITTNYAKCRACDGWIYYDAASGAAEARDTERRET